MQLLEVQERVEYNQLIGDAAENDDLETMYKVLTQMETLGVTPNKVRAPMCRCTIPPIVAGGVGWVCA